MSTDEVVSVMLDLMEDMSGQELSGKRVIKEHLLFSSPPLFLSGQSVEYVGIEVRHESHRQGCVSTPFVPRLSLASLMNSW